jgi:hypothetical protein
MKPILMRAVACECLLLVLVLLAAGAQKTAPELTTLQIEDLMNVDGSYRGFADGFEISLLKV